MIWAIEYKQLHQIVKNDTVIKTYKILLPTNSNCLLLQLLYKYLVKIFRLLH